ncbi:hypothetical protein FRB91_008890 [Serendipita sp. 411]|nr:hypothetical protein FRB91_008890 [Serendipita sp. 411]
MRFLDLPEDIITEIFTQIDQEWYSDRIAAFYSLRLVCKSLATLAEASVFSSLLVRLEGANLSGLSTRSSEIGKHVKRLDLDLIVDTSEKDWAEKLQLPQRDQQLAFLLSNLTSIRDITVHLLCNISIPLDKTRSALQSALGQIQYASILESTESRVERTTGTTNLLTDTLISTLVRCSGETLLSLSVDSINCIQPTTFVAVREHASQLRALVFRFSIGVNIRDILSQQVPWACRETLEHLALHCCRGGHAGAIACGISSGLWAKRLKTLEVSACGDPGDMTEPPYSLVPYERTNIDRREVSQDPPQTNTNILGAVHYEHESLWELQLLGRLPVKRATMTQIPRATINELLEQGLLPELQQLNIAKPVGHLSPADIADNEQFERNCARRDIQNYSNAEDVAQCYSSD